MAATGSLLSRFADFEDFLYSRRYSGVSFTHPRLEAGGLAELLAAVGSEGEVDIGQVQGWDVRRTAVRVPRNYFSKIDDLSLQVGDDYIQEFYVAWRRGGTDGFPGTAAIFAPYVRLLDRVLTAAGRHLEKSKIEYLYPDMDAVFQIFESGSPEGRLEGMSATRISVRDKDEPAVELISLTGRNPLKSNLRAELRDVGPAYSIRVEVRALGAPVNVHMDLFGNYFWYHRSGEDVAAPLRLLGELLDLVTVKRGEFRPTRRITVTEDSE